MSNDDYNSIRGAALREELIKRNGFNRVLAMETNGTEDPDTGWTPYDEGFWDGYRIAMDEAYRRIKAEVNPVQGSTLYNLCSVFYCLAN